MLNKKILFLVMIIGVFSIFGNIAKASPTGCSCYYSNKGSAGGALNDISGATTLEQCNNICYGISGGAGFYDFKNSGYKTIVASTTGANCSCAERVALNVYDIKSRIIAVNNGVCMDKCRTNGNDFYSYPNTTATVGITLPQMIDKFRYTFNCACLTGSLIPLYYPVNSLTQSTGGAVTCNNTCYGKSAQYYAFEATGALSGWKSPVKAPAVVDTTTDGIASDYIPGTTEAGGIVSCGRPGQKMCTLCDLIKGMNIIIQYLMKISIGVALLAMTIGGVMYVISAGDPTMTGNAKNAIKNAGIGFVIIFAGYLIINTTISYLGAKSTLGMKTATTWGNFECDTTTR